MMGNLWYMLHQLRMLLLPISGSGIRQNACTLQLTPLRCLTAVCIGIAALWHGRALALHKQDRQMQCAASA